MCLAVPGRIRKKRKEYAWVDFGEKVIKKVKITLTPQAKKGDYVIIHAGYAIQRMGKKEAKETIKLLKEFKIR